MIKLTGILQDTLLYEGLIHTADIDTTTHHLEMWTTSHRKFKITKTARNTILLKFGESLNENEFDNLNKHINNLGWFISVYKINKPPFENKKFELSSFKKDTKEHSLLLLFLEAKFDLEINKHELKRLYHTTLLKNKNKIEQVGLVPRTKSKISHHPERIYLTSSFFMAEALADSFAKDSNDKEFIIYKIDIDGLRRSNNGIRFFQDPNLSVDGFYTLSNIPPKFLKIEKQISLNKKMKV